MNNKSKSLILAKAFLYQWTALEDDFLEHSALGHLGGNRVVANRFRGIEADLKASPSVPHWLIAARRKEGVWGIYAILKIRQPTAEERLKAGFYEKYLYYEEAESGFLAFPGENPLVMEEINQALIQAIPGQTQGFNGTPIEVTVEAIEKIVKEIKLTIAERKDILRSNGVVSKASGARGPAESNSASQDSVIPIAAQANLESDTRSLKTAEREAVVKVRYGQGDFREALLKEVGEKCWMSGIEGKRLLVASHIKPWSHCNDDVDSRGRIDNGLLLSALWDSAFDAGLICFDSEWNVVPSSELPESAKQALGLSEHISLPEEHRSDGRRDYLAYHRAEVFEYWTKTK